MTANKVLPESIDCNILYSKVNLAYLLESIDSDVSGKRISNFLFLECGFQNKESDFVSKMNCILNNFIV